jgi:RNA-binding protein YhbY
MQRFAAVGDEISGYFCGRRHAFAVDEMPFVAVGITGVTDAVAFSEFGQRLRTAMLIQIAVRAARARTSRRPRPST